MTFTTELDTETIKKIITDVVRSDPTLEHLKDGVINIDLVSTRKGIIAIIKIDVLGSKININPYTGEPEEK